MNCNQLQWFCSACETRSFAKAAEATFVSRQAFGKAIKSMEDELGCTLFQRTEQGVVPTEAALRIYPIVQRCVSDMRSVQKICSEHAISARQTVRIAIADGVVESMDEFFFDELERNNPACDIVIEKHFYTRCMEYLKDGRVDFAIAPGPIAKEPLSSIPMAREKVFVAAAPETVRFPIEQATLEDLATLTYFSVGTGERAMLGLDELFRRNDLSFQVNDQYTEFGIVMRKAHTGTAAALVPESMLPRLAPDMAIIPLPVDLISWELDCFWLPRTLSNAEEGVIEFMRAHAASAISQ